MVYGMHILTQYLLHILNKSIKFTTFYSVYLTRRLHATVNLDITRYFKMTLIQHQSRTFYLMLKNAEFVVSLET